MSVHKLELVTVGENFRFDPDEILEAAKGKGFTTVVVIGELPDEDDWLSSSANAGETLILLERSLSCPQGDGLCTMVARLAQNALVVGEVLLHEVLESLRQLLTALLERQASVGAEELALLEALCEHLRGHLHEPPALEEKALASLQTRITRTKPGRAHLAAAPARTPRAASPRGPDPA